MSDNAEDRLEFATEEAASDWMYDDVDDPYTDNYRFAYEDDPAAMAKYQQIEEEGCCGFADYDIRVNGRNAVIGCNYGH